MLATKASGARLLPIWAHGAILTGYIPVAASFQPRIAGGAALVGHLDEPTRRNVPSTGSVMLRLQGAGFGHASYTAKTRIGATLQESSGGWISDSSILCQTPATGRLASVKQILTVGERSGSISESITYSLGAMSALVRMNRGGT